MISECFYEITGKQLHSEEPFFLRKYDKGGMSSGMIDPDYWKNVIMPLLLKRYNDLVNKF